MPSRRLHCIHCGQTFLSSDTDTCSLCQAKGGLVEPSEAPPTRDIVAAYSPNDDHATTRSESVGSAGTKPRKWIVPCSTGALVLLVLGGTWFFLSEGGGLRGDALTKNQLKRIWLAYNSFGDANLKGPSKLEDLDPFLRTNATWPPEAGKADRDCYEAIQNGKYTLVFGLKNFQKAKEGSELILAYETEAKQTVGFAIFADFRIQRLSRAQLEKSLNDMPRQ